MPVNTGVAKIVASSCVAKSPRPWLPILVTAPLNLLVAIPAPDLISAFTIFVIVLLSESILLLVRVSVELPVIFDLTELLSVLKVSLPSFNVISPACFGSLFKGAFKGLYQDCFF